MVAPRVRAWTLEPVPVILRLMKARSAPSGATIAAAGLGVAAITLVGADNGGYFERSWTWGALLFGCVAGIALVLRGPLGGRREGFVATGLIAAFLLWELASATWGIAGTQSVPEARRTLVYVAGLLAFLVVVEVRALPAFLCGTLVGIVGLSAYGLAYKLVAATPDTYEGRLLFQPTGYANAQGILAAMGVLLGIGFARRAGRWSTRVLAAAGAAFLAVALGLTNSTGSLVALAAGLAILFADRVPLRPVAAAAALVGLGLLVVHPTLPLGDRRAYWDAAASDVARHPWLGSGAGSFGAVWSDASTRPRGPRAFLPALDAHNLYLETLAETGPLGLALLLAALAAPFAALRHDARPASIAVPAAAYGAFLVHAGLDWDWEVPVVTLTGLACASALVIAARVESEPAGSLKSQSPSKS
jgi:O-antigen ligase